ncbi:MAG TPA: class II aldolase/adducin family protein [Candidatus Binatia bacterium]
MKKTSGDLKKNLVVACRILSREKLVRGFGHVSARIPGTELFLLTPRVSLALVKEKELLTLDLKGKVVEGRSAPPFEAPLHAAIFNHRPEVQAITRIHARKANYFSVTDRKIEPVHNHGSFFHGGVPVFAKTPLISTRELGAEVAQALGKNPAILLRGNGQVAVGRSIPEAVMMAIYLEEAADMLYGALQIGEPVFLGSEESGLGKEETLPPVDLERAWNYYKSKVKALKIVN